MNGKFQWKKLLIALALPLAVGTLASLIIGDSVLDYAAMTKPPLSPPGWVFPIVWSVLYALMGIASWLVWTSEASRLRVRSALILYGMQLAANFLWPVLFFLMKLYFAAFLWLLLLWGLVAVCTLRFLYIRKSSGIIMLPYLLWISFAAYLNIGVYLLN